MYTVRTWAVPAMMLALAACSGSDSNGGGGVDPSSLTATDSRMLSWSSVKVTPGIDTLKVGGTATLQASVKNFFGFTKTTTVTWSSNDTLVATVSSTGVVTARHAGAAIITASSGSAFGNSKLTVQDTSQTSTPTSAPTTTTSGSTTTTTSTANVTSTSTTTNTTSNTTTNTTTSSGSTSSTPTGTTTSTTTLSSSAVTTTSSSGSGLSGLGFEYDDFTEYSSTQALLARISTNVGGTASPTTALYNDGGNASLASIDNTVTYNGHPTMKYTQPGGVSTTPELWVDFAARKHIWFRTKIRFNQGFTTTGTLSNSANAYKLLGFAFDTYDGSGRLEITNTNQYQLYWNAQSKSTGALVGGGVFGLGGNITTEWSDGGWYDYILEVDFSQSSGIARIWMAPDGQTPVLRATSNGTMQSGLPLPSLTGIMLGMNFNQVRASTQSQAVWWGQWEVIDGTQHPNPFGVQ